MAIIQDNFLILKIGPAESDAVLAVQEALILAIETLARSERSLDDDCRDAVFLLSELLRASLLDENQMNLNGKRKKK